MRTGSGGRVSARLNRLFAADGRCFDVAVDHGLFGEGTFLAGHRDDGMGDRDTRGSGSRTLSNCHPAKRPISSGSRGRRSPRSCSARTSRTSTGRNPPRHLFSELVAGAVELALRLDAACVVCNLLQLPDQPELFRQCVHNVSALRAACDPVGMPLMVEPLVMQPGDQGRYGVDGDVEKIVPLVRQAVELGADVIKADPTDDLGDYSRVIEIAGDIPVLVRGGGRASDEAILHRTEEVMAQGAAGIVYGRNVIQHPDPAAMTKSLMAVVHDGVSAAQALGLLRG